MSSPGWRRRECPYPCSAAVRRCAARSGPVSLAGVPAAVRYFRPEDGGVSHFRYGRDNALLTWMHLRLFLGFLVRLPLLQRSRPAPGRSFQPGVNTQQFHWGTFANGAAGSVAGGFLDDSD